MRYKVSGVDSAGWGRTIILSASSESDAIAKAKFNGISPQSVTLAEDNEDEPPPKSLETQREPRPQDREHSEEPVQFKKDFKGRYVYRMVQIPPTISVREGVITSQLAAHFLEEVVNRYATESWEFYRIDEIGIHVEAGCLAALLGVGPSRQSYYVITFRKLAKQDSPIL